MSYSLLVDAGNSKAFKILVAAEFSGLDISVPAFSVGEDNKKSDFTSKSPSGKVPVLDCPAGSLSGSNTIAAYVAENSAIYPSDAFTKAKIGSWVEYASNEIDLPAAIWFLPTVGLLPANAPAMNKAKSDIKKVMATLEKNLGTGFLVGDSITLADIACVSSLVYVFRNVADTKFRAPFKKVAAWFEKCTAMSQFVNVIGKEALCEAEAQPVAVPVPAKKEQPKQEKKAKVEKKDEEPAPAPKKKEDHKFKVMDKEAPSEFNMDTWKKTYSNAKTDYKPEMETFWKLYEPKGWSLWRGEYKYNDENVKLFMTSNLIAGFIQRTEEIRKWLFGTMTIRGEEGKLMKISCHYLIRGQDIQPMLDANDDAECYDWTKIENITPEIKSEFFDYWCSEGPLDGEECLDSRIYK
jgi:elongation factor 1-gamma